ncbi:hypothetical protein [Natronoglycomyces albus]|uniref:Uncharacterized protein n=1 Tax=Natronoglycomyces albus TaxID=2811108 RepID=A0A895XTY8_9ACTN|nr:hypothetical protein [Natronoglycomyces albus]QSB07132.1 hypothetical protein JQS30_16860 [Natronoglycomyces albus]
MEPILITDPAIYRRAAIGIALSRTHYLVTDPDEVEDDSAEVTWAANGRDIHLHLRDLDWGFDLDAHIERATYGEDETAYWEDWERLGADIVAAVQFPGDFVDYDDEAAVPPHVAEALGLD